MLVLNEASTIGDIPVVHQWEKYEDEYWDGLGD